MILSIMGLLAGFILVLLLVAYLVLKTQLAIMVKLLVVCMVTVFYWVQYQSLIQYTGWPTTAALPRNFILIASEVHEPDPHKGDAGVMYWWIRESGNPDQPPRVYQLPYRAELHQKAEQVVTEQKQGAQYLGKSQKGADSASGLGVSFDKISKAVRYKKE